MSTTVTYKGNTLTTVDNQTRTLLTSGKYMEDDITLTDVSGSSPNLQTKTKTYTPTLIQQTETILPDAGYDGLDEVQITINAMATGTAGTPEAVKGPVTSNSILVTPTVTNTAGYVPSGTLVGAPATVLASDLVSGTKSITSNGTGIDVTNYAEVDVAVPAPSPTLQAKTNIVPTTSSQTITYDAGYDGLSSVEVNGDANLVAGNIKKNITIFSVTGTYEGGGGGSSSYTLISTQEQAVSTTSTTRVKVVDISGTYSMSDIIFVRIRDKVGKRNGYFYGSDTVFFPATSEGASTINTAGRRTYYVDSNGNTTSSQQATASAGYGVYGYTRSSTNITISCQYNATYSLTVDGTYVIEIYRLAYPDNIGPL